MFKYSIIKMFRSIGGLFWMFVFPLVLMTAMHFAFDSIYSYQNSIGNVYARGMDDVVEEADDTGTVVQSAKLIVSASVSITFEAE